MDKPLFLLRHNRQGLQWQNPGDGVTISSTFPLSTIATPIQNYMWITPQTLGSSPGLNTSLTNTTWTTVIWQPITSGIARTSTTNFNATNNSFIAPVAGHYILSACVIFSNGATNAHFQVGFADHTNSRTPDVAYYGNVYDSVFGNGKSSATFSTGPVFLEQNKELNVQAWQDSGGTVSCFGQEFSAIQFN